MEYILRVVAVVLLILLLVFGVIDPAKLLKSILGYVCVGAACYILVEIVGYIVDFGIEGRNGSGKETQSTDACHNNESKLSEGSSGDSNTEKLMPR